MKNAELIKLRERYPYMFSAPDTALELYLGWMGLLSDLCLEIDAMLGEDKRGFQWTRIREKAGIYHLGYRMDGRARWTAFLTDDGGIDHRFEPANTDAVAQAIERRVLAATDASRTSCVICGAKGTLAGDRTPWIVLCASHAENAFREGGVSWADAKIYDSRKANVELNAMSGQLPTVATPEEPIR